LTSLEQRLAEAEKERNRLQTNLDKKMQERESRKARLLNEVKRNRPELLRFNEKLGCRVSAGSEKPGGKGASTIKFTFNLINPDDYSYEAKFVIDASKSNYKSECGREVAMLSASFLEFTKSFFLASLLLQS
jgi:hypothetical protein